MKRATRTHFITGTDTGAGKTILTALLLDHLRAQGENAIAIKPLCTGPRDDVRLLQSLQPGVLTDDEMNPFHYLKPVTPLVASGGRLKQEDLVRAIRQREGECERLLVEGAGGLRVPLAPDVTWDDVVKILKCGVILAAQNRLGVLNHVNLTLDRLKTIGAKKVFVVLSDCNPPSRMDVSAASNERVLAGFWPETPFLRLPYLGSNLGEPEKIRAARKKMKKTLAQLVSLL
jgi:dethiobiotin synthetase